MAEFDLPPKGVDEFSDFIRDAIGVGDYEQVIAATPQFECPSGRKVYYWPRTAEEFEALKKAPDEILLDIGLRRWEEGHWLFPGEWYDYIPDGLEIVDISGGIETFKRGETGDDIRGGCLAYGFLKGEEENRG